MFCHGEGPLHQQTVIGISEQATPVLSYEVGITYNSLS
jgi:hypothetical protein